MVANQNPLLNNAAAPSSGETSKQPKMVICLVSTLDSRQVVGIDHIRSQLEKRRFILDHFEYKVTNKVEMRRPINPKIKNGPTEKITVEEKVNVNANLKTMRQLTWRVLKDPENVLLVQVTRPKGETLSVPLIFNKILKSHHSILVTGANHFTQLQLLSKPDLTFKRIPKIIEDKPDFKLFLLQRSKRKKGLQASMREIQEIQGLPEDVREKIIKVITGQRIDLTDPEAINLLLLADLYSRYSAMFHTFQIDFSGRKLSTAALSKQFLELTHGIKTSYLVQRLKVYLGENGDKCRKNTHVFHLLCKALVRLDEKKIVENGKILQRSSLFALLKSIIFISRSQQDPDLWKQCLFFKDPNDELTDAEENNNVLDRLSGISEKRIIDDFEASSHSLFEIHLTHNLHNFVFGKRVWASSEDLEDFEVGVINSVIIPRIHFKPASGAQISDQNRLFRQNSKTSVELVNPIHFSARAYGFLMSKRLYKNVKSFLSQQIVPVEKRLGNYLFPAMYEKLVFEPGLPISRNQFADLLEKKQLIRKVKEKGHISSNLETGYDELLNDQILCGDGISPFDKDFGQDEFTTRCKNAKTQFKGFIKKIRRMKDANPDEFNPAHIFVNLMEEGQYNFRSPFFRDQIKSTYLYEELSEIVTNSCMEIKDEIADTAIKDKAILQIPLSLEPLLFIGNTFQMNIAMRLIDVHLIASPVDSSDKLPSLSEIFSSTLEKYLEGESTPEKKSLKQTLEILKEYQKASAEYFRYLTILVIDRHLDNLIQTDNEMKQLNPSHLKHYFIDKQKLIIGSTRGQNLSNILQYDTKITAKQTSEVDTLSIGQFIQQILHYKTALGQINRKRATIKTIIKLLNKFSSKLKDDPKWKRYHRMISKFSKILELPIQHLTKKAFVQLSDISQEIRALVKKEEYKEGVIALLFAEWKRRNPDRKNDIYFYDSFLDSTGSGKDNLLFKIRAACQLANSLSKKRCIIFFPERAKEHQLKQMKEIMLFLNERYPLLDVYVETQTLDEETQGNLAKKFHPKNFFLVDQLKPEPYEMKKAVKLKVTRRKELD